MEERKKLYGRLAKISLGLAIVCCFGAINALLSASMPSLPAQRQAYLLSLIFAPVVFLTAAIVLYDWASRPIQPGDSATMTPTTAPRRRWFSYSLRTLFVLVTVVAVWLGLELRFVRERESWLQVNKALIRAREPIELQPIPARSVSVVGMWTYSRPTNGSFPFWRKWLGDAPVEYIVFPEGWTDQERVKRLFPEAELEQMSAIQP
jgi:hypothetical protein